MAGLKLVVFDLELAFTVSKGKMSMIALCFDISLASVTVGWLRTTDLLVRMVEIRMDEKRLTDLVVSFVEDILYELLRKIVL